VTTHRFLACAAIAFSTAAAAQTAPKPVSRADFVKAIDARFNLVDTNHDGKLTRDEMVAQQQRDLASGKAKLAAKFQDAFRRLDTNKDGKLTLEEFMASAPTIRTTETPDQLLQTLDTNHDGKVSAEEFRAPNLAKFNKVDANHDGVVTVQEQQAAAGAK
jgi:5-hydroxyisourate hydrolase-like protein (transthyretin family)